MRFDRLLLTVAFSAFCAALPAQNNTPKPYGLMTDLLEYTDCTWEGGYLCNTPVGKADKAQQSQYALISSSRPTFGWICPDTGSKQTSYRIVVSETGDNKGVVWDSGTVESGKSTAVAYEGVPLKPGEVYYWSVELTMGSDTKTYRSDMKIFRTAPELSEYSVSYYPQMKTLDRNQSGGYVDGGEAIFVDFGKAAFGQLLLTVTSPEGGDSVTVHLGETAKDGRVDRNPGGTIRYRKYVLPLIGGTNTYRIKIRKDGRNTGSAAIRMPDYIGEVLPFRYCEIELQGIGLELNNVTREMVHYPFADNTSSFRSSDSVLNRVWDMCKYSIKATSFAGIYVDGDRERIPYEADALINQLCHYGVDREYSMARRTHEYLLEHPTWPTEWILQSVLIAWYDYMYTGDSRSLRANYDVLKARTLLALREKNGLISTTTGLQTKEFLVSINRSEKIRDIVDWPHTGILGLNKAEGGEADGFVFTDYNAVTNAYHYEALKIMGRVAGVLGMDAEEKYFEKEAEAFLDRYNKFFFDKKSGRYVDGDTTKHSSLHANMFPVAFGMVPERHLDTVVEFIRSRKMACSVYGAQFLMDALYEAADAGYALQMLTKTDDRSWYNMIRAGSTISMEAWDNKYKPNQDWNHAWGAVPANIIPRKLMGVEPLLPGFEKVRIRPQVGSLEWAEAKVPTIKGAIGIAIQNKEGEFAMNITVPPNMEAEVYLPLPSKKYEVTVGGEKQKTRRAEGRSFIYAGTLPSGSHEIKMTY